MQMEMQDYTKGVPMHSLDNYFRTKLNVMALVYVSLIAIAIYVKHAA